MRPKHSFEYVYDFYLKNNCILLESVYCGNKTKMRYICQCGEESSNSFEKFQAGGRCKKCGIKKRTKSNPRNLKFEQVKSIFEKENCILLSDIYINGDHVLDFICSCGRKDSIKYNAFRRGGRCKDCGLKKKSDNLKYTFEEVRDYFLEQGCVLLENEYMGQLTIMNFICSCGRKGKVNFRKFKGGQRKCKACANESIGRNLKYSIEFVKEYFIKQKCFLLDEIYVDCKTEMKFVCSCGIEDKITFDQFKNYGKRCSKCWVNIGSFNMQKDSKGLSGISGYLRLGLIDWKQESLYLGNFECCVTGETDNLKIHHLTPFNKIVKETLRLLDINTNAIGLIVEISEDELIRIKNKFLEIHNKYGLGAIIKEELHNEFHSLYGKINFTPKDFEDYVIETQIDLGIIKIVRQRKKKGEGILLDKIKKIPQVKCGYCGLKSDKPLNIQESNKKYYHIESCHSQFLAEKELQRIENEQWSDLFEYLKILHDVPTLPPRNIKRLHELRRGNDVKEGKVYLRYKQGATFDLLLDAYRVAEDKIKWFIHDVLHDGNGAEDINKCITLMLNDGLNQAWKNRQQKKKNDEENEKISRMQTEDNRSTESPVIYKKKNDDMDISHLL